MKKLQTYLSGIAAVLLLAALGACTDRRQDAQRCLSGNRRLLLQRQRARSDLQRRGGGHPHQVEHLLDGHLRQGNRARRALVHPCSGGRQRQRGPRGDGAAQRRQRPLGRTETRHQPQRHDDRDALAGRHRRTGLLLRRRLRRRGRRLFRRRVRRLEPARHGHRRDLLRRSERHPRRRIALGDLRRGRRAATTSSSARAAGSRWAASPPRATTTSSSRSA